MKFEECQIIELASLIQVHAFPISEARLRALHQMRREVRGRRRGSTTTLTPSPARPTTSVWTLANNLPLMPSLLAASVQVQHGFLGGAGISFPLRISVLHARAHGEVTCLRAGAAFAGTRCTAGTSCTALLLEPEHNMFVRGSTIAGLAVWPWPWPWP